MRKSLTAVAAVALVLTGCTATIEPQPTGTLDAALQSELAEQCRQAYIDDVLVERKYMSEEDASGAFDSTWSPANTTFIETGGSWTIEIPPGRAGELQGVSAFCFWGGERMTGSEYRYPHP